MCGPILLAIPMDAATKRTLLFQMLIYHSGRILTYAALGVLFGLAGKGISVAGLQQVLSVLAGFFMIGMAFFAWKFEYFVANLPGFGSATKWVQQKLGILLRKKNNNLLQFNMGLLNGLLPCGMVYAALAGAIATAEGLGGGLFMAAFGLGTLPLLLSVNLIGQSAKKTLIRHKIRYAQPILLVLSGLILLQRGLHTDLSFLESVVPKALLQCH